MNHIISKEYKTPFGVLLLAADDKALRLCSWFGTPAHETLIKRLGAELKPGDSPLLNDAVAQLNEYFAGARQTFTIPLKTCGTPFQQTVWQMITKVPFGDGISYSALAELLERPSAVRAVANAVGANPLSLFIPCHRIVARNGLGGYAGGSDTKRKLLNLEK